MTPSKILFYFSLSFILGIFIASFFNIPQFIIYEFFILGLFYGLIFFRKQLVLIFGICFIILGLGIIHTNNAISKDALSGINKTLNQEKVSNLKYKLKEIIYENFSPPHSSILAALILGEKGKISQEWKQKLSRAGILHIIAISGMHIVILAGLLTWFFIGIGISRPQSFYFVFIILWFYIYLIGFQSSAIRAGIMGSIFLLAQKIGLQKASLRILVLAAALMLIFNPLYLRYDIGFQLSFLATLGLIYLLPFFQNLFEKFKPFKILEISYLLAITFSAQIFVLPILIYNFGYFSIISPITNILIVPISSPLMAGGFLLLIFGSIHSSFAWLISLPIYLLLEYLVFIVNFLSNLSISYVAIQTSWILIPIYYLILSIFLYCLEKRKKQLIAF